MGTGLLVTMAGIAIASAIFESILNGTGRQTEAQYMSLAAKSSLAILALGVFVKVIKLIASLGG
jgi:hypothetical protein